ncbi:MAG TPA: sigma 54-interacting transcriptional regulator, partial [Gemmataceae bacterium]|nr:sigma 54-interacting transcriptional regulator [Gemmataceae bacterium]
SRSHAYDPQRSDANEGQIAASAAVLCSRCVNLASRSTPASSAWIICDTAVRFHSNPALVGSHREGLIILEDGRIAGANPAAVKILKTSWQKILGVEIGAVFSGDFSGHGDIRTVKSFDGRVYYSRHERNKTAPRQIEPAPSQLPRQSPRALDGDPFLNPVLDRARRMLDAGLSVLILGETGVGKEYFARRLHALSNRCKGPFVEVNCGALPDSLIDSELFGYEEGAFTGARRRGMRGQIREADGGILFLDEIGDLPLSLQARLLRVLQERKIRPLGGIPIPVDFALVCATHQDLPGMVTAATFRADLYYRLQDYCVHLPSLRERPDRRVLISNLFSTLGGEALQLTLDETAVEALVRYRWPGNIRELTSTLRSMVALAEPKSRLGFAELPCHIRETQNLATATETIPASLSVNQEAIAEALKAANGNVSKAARLLGIHRSTLYRHLPAS